MDNGSSAIGRGGWPSLKYSNRESRMARDISSVLRLRRMAGTPLVQPF
jgi:hypothetical protein